LAGDEAFGGGISFLTGSGFLETFDYVEGLRSGSPGVGPPGVIKTFSLTMDLSFFDLFVLFVFTVAFDTSFGLSSLLETSKFDCFGIACGTCLGF